MKNLARVCVGLLTMSCLFLCSSLEASSLLSENINEFEIENSINPFENDLIGRWMYKVADAPEGYDKGVLVIGKDNGAYSVGVKLSQGTLMGQDIVVKGNEIKFNLNIEGQNVAVTLEAKGAKISGESSSVDGVFKIDGTKMPEPE